MKHSLPQYFSLTIVDGDIGTQNLKSQVERLFEIVDILEEECEEIDFSKNEIISNDLETK